MVSSITYTMPDLGQYINICYGDTLIFDVTMDNALSYKWQNGATEPIIKVYQPGIYSVSVTTDCEILKDSVTVQVEASDLFIPNVITPNGDGINDNFEIKTGTNELALKVLNRWDRLVYESDSYHNNWRGGNLSAGTYYYLIQDKCTNRVYKGWLHIMRD